MKLPKNTLSGTARPPKMFLCEVDKTIIGGLNPIAPSGIFKWNTYNEITMEIDRMYEHPSTGKMEVNPLYNKIEALRLIYIAEFNSYFEIQQANIISDGIREYKEVVAYSLEYQLSQKYLDSFVINMGTTESIDGVQLYDISDISKSLIHLALEKTNGAWTVGHIDYNLQKLHRSFEIDHQTIYDFLMNDVSDAFQCVFEFDTNSNTVNIYDESSYGLDTNIHVSMDTIANEVQVNYSADDIKTVLYVYGSDDISIREVNLGLDYIANIDYYFTEDWLGKGLYNAYNNYCNMVESYRGKFSELMLDWSELYDEYSELYNKVPDYEEDTSDSIPTVYSYSDLPKAAESNVYKVYRVAEGDATWYYICKSEVYNGTTQYKWVLDVDNISSFYHFPTPSIEYVGCVYQVYNQDSTAGVLYYKCESYLKNDNTAGYRWILAESGYGINLLKEKEACYLDIQEVQVSAGFAEKTSDQYDRYLENYNKLVNVQETLRKEMTKANNLQKQLDDLMSKMNAISADIQIDKNFTKEQIITLNSFMREDTYDNDNFLITELDDDKSAMQVRQELMDAAQKELAKISQPQLSFSMSLANILAIPEFEPVIDNFECGNFVKVEIRPGYVVKTQILEVDINFDDMSDFTVTFGNLHSLYSQIDIHAELMSQAVSAGRSVAESGSYWQKGADTATSIGNRIENGLIDANTEIKSTENQAISWDSHGLHLRKYADESKSSYLDEQIWMNNEKIVFTDDNWRTAQMAIGQFHDENIGDTYGIIAPSIVGTLLAGQNLVIDCEKKDGGISSFRVDENGAKLYNSTFLMQRDNAGAIVIDPQYGIVAGDKTFTYTTNSDGSINIPMDSTGFPENSSFFLDIDSGDAYFKGTVYSDGDSIFKGKLEAATGSFAGKITSYEGDIGGWIIKTGILHSDTSTNGSKFVGISSKYDTNGYATDYALWAGNQDPSKASFSVKRDGTLYAKSGTFSGELAAATGSFKGSINVADNFIVDASGNVTMNGAVNFTQNIVKVQYSTSSSGPWQDSWNSSWTNIEVWARYSYNGGSTWTNAMLIQGKNGQNGSSASVPKYIKSTYIDFSSVSSPTMIANEVKVLGVLQVGYGSRLNNQTGGFMGCAYGKDATDNETYGVALADNGTYLEQTDYDDEGNLINVKGVIKYDTHGRYVVVTDKGVRLQAYNNNIALTENNIYMSVKNSKDQHIHYLNVNTSGAFYDGNEIATVDYVDSKIGSGGSGGNITVTAVWG